MQCRVPCVTIALTIGAISLLRATTADAQIFTNRTDWNAAAGASVTENFETAPVGLLASGTTSLGQVSVTIDSSAAAFGLPQVVDGGNVNGSREIDGYITFPGSGGPNFMTFTFPSPVTAWGADFISTTSGGKLVVETAGNVYPFENYLRTPGDGFLGIVSVSPFTFITIRKVNPSLGEEFSIDNLSFHSAAASVPEPASTLFGLAFAISGVIALRRRRRRAGGAL